MTCRPTLDQLHGRNTQEKNSGRNTWKGRTLGGAFRGSTPGEPRWPEQRLQAAGMGVKAKNFTFLTFLEGQKNILRTNTPNPNPCLGFTPGQCLGH